MKKLFQYAVLLHTYDKEGKYEDSKMIIPISSALAKSEKDLIFKITRDIPDTYAENPDNIEIVVRNF
jgi:hypothetical protein